MTVLYAGAGAALISLDRTLVGQWMLSRPVVLGTALGWFLGDVQTGWWVGLLLEAISLDTEPVGGVLGLNATIAVSAVLLAALGPARLPLAAAFPLGLAVGAAYTPLEEMLRKRRNVWTGRFRAALRAGERAPWPRAVASSCLEEFGAALIVLTAGTAAAAEISLRAWAILPAAAQDGFTDALSLAPLIAAGALIWRLIRKDRFGI